METNDTTQDIINRCVVAWKAYGLQNAEDVFKRLCSEHKLTVWEQVVIADRVKKVYEILT